MQLVGKWVAKVLFLSARAPPSMKKKGAKERYPAGSAHAHGDECDTTRFVTYSAQLPEHRDQSHLSNSHYSSAVDCQVGTNGQPPGTEFRSLELELRDLRKAYHTLEERMDSEAEFRSRRSVHMREWIYIGLVLDRFFFVLYLVLLVGSMAALFPRHKITW